jgi:superoxide dismutase, Cu-Zn family
MLIQSIVVYASLILISISAGVAAAPTVKNVTLKNAKGETVGTAAIASLQNGVKINLDVQGLPPGPHAIHFHENGTCQTPSFETAGGHFAPHRKQHGFDSGGGPHAGDMSNFFVADNGSAKVEMVNTAVNFGKGSDSLLKTGGTALIIHEKGDDYKTQPAGDAGGRLACGEIH